MLRVALSSGVQFGLLQLYGIINCHDHGIGDRFPQIDGK
jgi:hypothetical protein